SRLMFFTPTAPPTAPGTAPASADSARHAGRFSCKVAQPLSATKTSTPPAVCLTNRLMTLSLSRLVHSRLPPSKSDSKGLVTSMLLSRSRGVNIQNARERPARGACCARDLAYNFVHVAGIRHHSRVAGSDCLGGSSRGAGEGGAAGSGRREPRRAARGE